MHHDDTLSLEDFAGSVQNGTRLLGIDPGTKTLGMAISDRGWAVASPIGTVNRTKFKHDAEELRKVCEERKVGGVVMGLPVNMDGTEGPRCQSVRQLASNLENLDWFDIPIFFWDERLSTSAVEKFLVQEADMTRKRRAEIVDKAAAAYILQGALDAFARLNPSDNDDFDGF